MTAAVPRPLSDRAFAFVVTTALLSSLAFAAPVAAEHGRSVESNGNSGTIKIHAGLEPESPMLPSTEPHPGCFYHIHGFHFPPEADVVYTIHAWSPDEGRSLGEVDSGTATTDDIGDLYVTPENQPLPNGHYKAFVDRPDAPGSAPYGEKKKAFWIECGGQAGGVLGSRSAGMGGGVLGGHGGPGGGTLPDTAASEATPPMLPALATIAIVGLVAAHGTLRRRPRQRDRS